jgi:hypothetical protein
MAAKLNLHLPFDLILITKEPLDLDMKIFVRDSS